MNEWWIGGFIVLFIGSWIGIAYVISFMGGWGALAAQYPAPDDLVTDRNWNFRSARLRANTRYNGAISIGTNPRGIRFSMIFLFRPGHKPIFVPWGDVTVTSEKRWLQTFTVFHFARVPDVTIALWPELARDILTPPGQSPHA
ncbi:MAG TPA: hypothetical protein VJZ00_24495 [Thermoanaerobaculia bacterium]|nr:hypothetical protein [Thermoanaerobaculia bacterium]